MFEAFALEFYTRDVNWHVVGNDISVFFNQDTMKVPNIIHVTKPKIS